MARQVFYQGIGPRFSWFDFDVEAATLTKRGEMSAPANVQYAWRHPTQNILYIVSSDGGPGGIPSTYNVASAYRIDASGGLTPHGEPAELPSRPIHCCVDRSGSFLLTAFNLPSNITVHRINSDGTLGVEVIQKEQPDAGIIAHQVMTTPGNRTAILVTRGNNPQSNKPEDPGALKVFGFDNGLLTLKQSIAPGSGLGKGLGFGPRHLDFHPTKPWVLLSVERQSQLFVYALNADGTLSDHPLFERSSLADRASHGHTQMAGAIHVHPNGRFVYLTNRNSGTVEHEGRKVFRGGENNVAVFALDPSTGEPTLIQNIEAQTNHLRTFAIDPSGRLLIAAGIQPIGLRDGGVLPAALVLYRIGEDGRLTFARKYEVDTGPSMQFWTGIVQVD